MADSSTGIGGKDAERFNTRQSPTTAAQPDRQGCVGDFDKLKLRSSLIYSPFKLKMKDLLHINDIHNYQIPTKDTARIMQAGAGF